VVGRWLPFDARADTAVWLLRRFGLLEGKVAVVTSKLVAAALPLAILGSPFSSTGLCGVDASDPRSYAMSLAQNDVPGGVVVPAERLASRAERPPDLRSLDKAAFRGSLAARVEAFNSTSKVFRASEHDGVVHIRSVDEPIEVTRSLAQSVDVTAAQGVPAISAVFRQGVAAMRGFEPQAILGSGSGGFATGPECPIYSPVEVNRGPMTTVALLDQIVRQVPGLVWVVTYRKNAMKGTVDVDVGVLCWTGWHATISVFR